MGRAPEVATDRGFGVEPWYFVAIGATVWAVFFATVDLEGAIGRPVADAIVLLALAAWPAIPVAMALDFRRLPADAAWAPATKSWLLASLVPFVNAVAGLAYCLRRRSAVRGELPSARWRFGVYAGLVAWVVIVGIDATADGTALEILEPVVFGPLLVVVLVGFPLAVYLDAVRLRAETDGPLRLRVLVALSAVPLLNLLVGTAYAGSQWWRRRRADPDAEPTLPGGVEGRTARPEPVSPWYRRAAGVFLAYLLVLVVLGAWLPLADDLVFELLALAVWLPFGLAFVVCFHLDNRAVRAAGVRWGRTRYLYYSTALFSGPAFWYLLSRLTKVDRARRKGRLDDGGDGTSSGGTPAGDRG